MDELIVQAEALPEVPAEQIGTLQNELATRLKAKGLRSIVQMMAPGSLERTEFKARRIIDKRDLYDRSLITSSV
jgi:phenylacetate-coenzyme A ligase PaaK-like adenylate-forming protein